MRDAVEKEAGARCGESSKDGWFTLEELECAGCCVNAPMVAIDDDYYEDVTVEGAVDLVKAVREGRLPPPGPQNGRINSAPLGVLTSLVDGKVPTPVVRDLTAVKAEWEAALAEAAKAKAAAKK